MLRLLQAIRMMPRTVGDTGRKAFSIFDSDAIGPSLGPTSLIQVFSGHIEIERTGFDLGVVHRPIAHGVGMLALVIVAEQGLDDFTDVHRIGEGDPNILIFEQIQGLIHIHRHRRLGPVVVEP